MAVAGITDFASYHCLQGNAGIDPMATSILSIPMRYFKEVATRGSVSQAAARPREALPRAPAQRGRPRGPDPAPAHAGRPRRAVGLR